MELYLDIETLPAQRLDVLDMLKEDAERAKAEIRAPSNYKDEAKIAEYIAAKCAEVDAAIDEKYRKTALDGTYGEICVIGIAVDDNDPVTLSMGDEAAILINFNRALQDAFEPNDRMKWIGHNLVNFDLPFLQKRFIINGIKPSLHIPFNTRPYSEFVFDTMNQWAGYGNRISLDRLARALGFGGKGDFDGSMVWDAVRNGEIERVAQYCADDVLLTRDIYKRMTFK